MSVFAIVVAAGDGARLGLAVRKAHAVVGGRPLPGWSVAAFETHPGFTGGVLVVHEDDVAVAAPQWIVPWSRTPERWAVVPGGATRAASVRAGLRAAEAADAEWVAVHDAARPLLSAEDLARVIAAAQDFDRAGGGGAILAHPIQDTVKQVAAGSITATLDRSSLYGAETPQVFRRTLLNAAIERAGDAVTDDASAVELLPRDVAIVCSRNPNPKLTDSFDLRVIEALLAESP